MSQHFQRFLGDVVVEHVVFHPFTLGNHVCGATTSEAVGGNEDTAFQSGSRREHQSGERMHPYGHPRHPSCHHAEQTSLGSH